MKTGIITMLFVLYLPVTAFATTLRLSNDIDLLVLDGKKSPVHCCAARTASNWTMARISLCFALRRPFACPATRNDSTFLPAGDQL